VDTALFHHETHLRQVLDEYLMHYNSARPHRTLRQLSPHYALTVIPEPINLAEYQQRRKPILRALTNEYQVGAHPPAWNVRK